MKVSIITPAHNAAGYIRETIDSILAQTHKEWELLITDDASTDNTCEIVEQYMKSDNRIRLFRLKKNLGPAGARNNSTEQASGRFIAFCDSDDFWTPDKLTKQIDLMVRKGYAFTYAPYHIISESGRHIETIIPRKKVSYHDLLNTCDIGCLTAVYDTRITGKTYMAPLWNKEDYALWLQLLKKVGYAYSCEEPLGYYRLRENSISSNKLRTIKYLWSVYYKMERLGFLRSVYYSLVYVWHGIKKYGKLKYWKKR